MNPPLSTKPVLTILKWQAIATFAIAVVAGVWAGGHAALSAVVLQLWFVLTQYRDLVSAAFFAAFIVTVLLSSVALLARDDTRKR